MFWFALYIVYLAVMFWPVTLTLLIAWLVWRAVREPVRRRIEAPGDELDAAAEREKPLREIFHRLADKPVPAKVFGPLSFGRWSLGILALPFPLLGAINSITGGGVNDVGAALPGWMELGIYGALSTAIWYGMWRGALRFAGWWPTEQRWFGAYAELMAWAHEAGDAQEALARAPALRAAAKEEWRGVRRYYRYRRARESGQDNPEFFDSERLAVLLAYLEKYFPRSKAQDDKLRQRYWNYSEPIYQLLALRGAAPEGSLFERGYAAEPEEETGSRADQGGAGFSESAREQRLRQHRARLDREGARMRAAPLFGRRGQAMSVEDALDLTGLLSVPDAHVLGKFEAAAMRKAPPGDRAELGNAFRVLKAAAQGGQGGVALH